MQDLGVSSARIRTTGNVKYDLPVAPPFPDADRLRRAAAGRPVVVAASTAEGEEETVLEAWRAFSPRPLLAIAPRRPERFDEVARRVEAAGLSLVRRSGEGGAGPADVYLLDSIGELASLYSHARVAFVGGSLVRKGGHNPIAAWAAGVPVLVGPHTENFREIAAKGESLGILTRVSGGAGLTRELAAALADPAGLERRGRAARCFVEENRGSAEATAREVLALLPPFPARRGAAR
jgi:3-deoxy-D-manno-octulosonic-acid transferase